MLTSVVTRTLSCIPHGSRAGLKIHRSPSLPSPLRHLTTTTAAPTTTTTSTAKSGRPHLYDAEGFVRDARLEDYQQVVDINHDVYNGRDYLPSMYASFVRDPRMHCYVFENKGQVVGFEAACVVDGGQTLVYRGARTSSEMQGHGVMRRLRRHLLDQLTADHKVRYLAMTTSNTSGLAKEPGVLKTNDLLASRAIHVFPYEASVLNQLPDQLDFQTQKLDVLTSDQLCDFFENPVLRKYFFPHDRVIINTVPFRLSGQNREVIQLENPHVVVSEKVLEASKRGNSPESGLASASTWFSCPVGVCVDLELYGRSSNFPELCNHVGHHLRHIRHLGQRGQLMVPHARSINADVLLCVMARFNLTPMDCPFKVQYLFEQDLEKHPL